MSLYTERIKKHNEALVFLNTVVVELDNQNSVFFCEVYNSHIKLSKNLKTQNDMLKKTVDILNFYNSLEKNKNDMIDFIWLTS